MREHPPDSDKARLNGSIAVPTKQNSKPLSFRAIDSTKPGSRDLSDTGEYRGLRVSCKRKPYADETGYISRDAPV